MLLWTNCYWFPHNPKELFFLPNKSWDEFQCLLAMTEAESDFSHGFGFWWRSSWRSWWHSPKWTKGLNCLHSVMIYVSKNNCYSQSIFPWQMLLGVRLQFLFHPLPVSTQLIKLFRGHYSEAKIQRKFHPAEFLWTVNVINVIRLSVCFLSSWWETYAQLCLMKLAPDLVVQVLH